MQGCSTLAPAKLLSGFVTVFRIQYQLHIGKLAKIQPRKYSIHILTTGMLSKVLSKMRNKVEA